MVQGGRREVEDGIEKERDDLIMLQAEHSEYLFKRENEILDKIEQEQHLTPEEAHLIWVRVIRHLQYSLDRVAQNGERD